MGSMRSAAALACALIVGCSGATSAGHSRSEEIVSRVTAIHGGAGPFVVAGYRMGERALADLSLTRGSFDVEVEHTSPATVQFSCIADGFAAATGASVGRLNLRRIDATDGSTRTLVRDRRNGRTVVLRLASGFLARFLNVPMPGLGAAGQAVLGLRDDEIFEVVSERPGETR